MGRDTRNSIISICEWGKRVLHWTQTHPVPRIEPHIGRRARAPRSHLSKPDFRITSVYFWDGELSERDEWATRTTTAALELDVEKSQSIIVVKLFHFYF
jgi:hypothetical protein